jgi:TolB protein
MERLTYTDGRIFDFAISTDGQQIVYSAHNDQNGIDLWLISGPSSEPQLLLPCQSDWCSNPAFSPDGSRLAYSRRRAGINPGSQPGVPRIWTLDMNTLGTEGLYVDPQVGGYEPSWSSDGRFLAFFDGLNRGLRVLDVQTQQDFLIASEMGQVGVWAPQGRLLYYVDLLVAGVMPYTVIYEVDALTQQIRPLLGSSLSSVDYSVPVLNPIEPFMAVALRMFTGGPSKQIWLAPLEGAVEPGEEGELVESEQQQPITDQQNYTHGSIHWSPAGDLLVFQRLELGVGMARPEVVVWNQDENTFTVLAEDAYQPKWQP